MRLILLHKTTETRMKNTLALSIQYDILPLKPAAMMVPRIPPPFSSCGPRPSPATAKQRSTTSMQ